MPICLLFTACVTSVDGATALRLRQLTTCTILVKGFMIRMRTYLTTMRCGLDSKIKVDRAMGVGEKL